jgi:hypothetical protein
MAKKSRRSKVKFRVAQQSGGSKEIRTSESAKIEATPKMVVPLRRVSPAVMKANRYGHVIPELLRISIISAVLFLIIIILSVVIN